MSNPILPNTNNTIFAENNQTNMMINSVECGAEIFQNINQKCNECQQKNRDEIVNQSRKIRKLI